MSASVTLRMMMAGPVLISALILPHVAPVDWWAAAGSLTLFGILGLGAAISLRTPALAYRPAFVVSSILLANGAAGLAMLASRDLANTLSLGLVAAMSYQANASRHRGFAALSWAVGNITFAVAHSMLGAPAEHVLTRSVVFAGITGIIVATIQFLITSAHRSKRDAQSLAKLARAAAAARELEEGVRGAEQFIRAVTGAERVALWFEDQDRCPDGDLATVLPLGLGSRGRTSLVLFDVRRASYVSAVADLLTQLCERDRVLADLLRHSRTDPVTGVANRRVLDEAIAEQNPMVLRCVVMLDLDRFKGFNDRYGHLAGDDLLARFAQVLVEQVRPGDHVSRYGGEEFCLVLDADVDAAVKVVERIRGAWEHQDELVTFSAGVAREATADGGADESALARADRALYQAKAAGRNRTIVDGALPVSSDG